MFKVVVDFAYDEQIQPILTLIEKHLGKIVDFVSAGPAGGNPNMHIAFREREAAISYLRERYPDDDEAFSSSRIRMEA